MALRQIPITAWVGLILTGFFAFCAIFAPWIAPHDPFDPRALSLMNAFTPPVWHDEGKSTFPLGTDNQGRDVLSAIGNLSTSSSPCRRSSPR